jgi:NAD-dependent dihydropyrimidine dehydrogenase PreA subunit
VCPVDAIHPGKSDPGAETALQLYINADCICCAACVPVCPVSAIYAEEDLPDKWKHYSQINRDWYANGAK